jgi:chaperonin cofactor prefoldin
MEKQEPLSVEEEKLKSENATLRKRIRMLEAELLRLQAKLVSTWGEA